ncbi:DUF4446 family protein [Candidatus Gottesmanbacteria bacterium]|nr:DUF4446 family protein [Candidatus Gottesmanbacteria bacterium]
MGNIEILFLGEIALTISLIIGGFFLYKTINHYRRLIIGSNKTNLESLLEEIIANNEITAKEIRNIKEEIEKVKKDARLHIKKASVLRFNPFGDTGGNQSFIIALLDEEGTGIVVTSLHTRGITRWYAKNVKQSKGVNHELSKEEIEAIKSTK